MQKRYFGSMPTGETVTLVTKYGLQKKITLRKTVTKKCSTPRQICIKCTASVIHKNSKSYALKVCEGCLE